MYLYVVVVLIEKYTSNSCPAYLIITILATLSVHSENVSFFE